MPLPERKKFDAGLPPVEAVPPAPVPEPEPEPDVEPEPKVKAAPKAKGASKQTRRRPGPDPHYIRRERRRPDVDLVQLGTRIRGDLRRELRAFCSAHEENITDFIERSVEYMLDNSKERPSD